MSCNEIRDQLSEYLDGGLSVRQRQEIDVHLQSCLICRRALPALHDVVNAANHLPAEIPPSRDLWPRIASRLPEDRPGHRPTALVSDGEGQWWSRLAAAAVAAVALSIPLTVWWVDRHEERPPVANQQPVTTEDEGETNRERAELARTEDGVMLARTDLLTVVEFQRGLVADDTLRVFEQNMVLLDQAIGEIRAALEEDPYNHRLRLQLAARYQQEKKLLQRVSRV